MITTVKDIMTIAEKIAPPGLAADWDNTGLIIGRIDMPAKKILFALDATDEVISEAVRIGANIIITHHPILFKPTNKIVSSSPLGATLLTLIENRIAALAMHTNLDAAEGGTNDVLAETLGITDTLPLGEPPSMGRIGNLSEPMNLDAFAERVKTALGLSSVRFCGDPASPIKRVCVVCGSGSDIDIFKQAVGAGADAYVTGDIRYHEAQRALSIGLSLIDATHYASENLVIEKLKARFDAGLAGIGIETAITETDGQVFKTTGGI